MALTMAEGWTQLAAFLPVNGLAAAPPGREGVRHSTRTHASCHPATSIPTPRAASCPRRWVRYFFGPLSISVTGASSSARPSTPRRRTDFGTRSKELCLVHDSLGLSATGLNTQRAINRGACPTPRRSQQLHRIQSVSCRSTSMTVNSEAAGLGRFIAAFATPTGRRLRRRC